MVVDATLTKKSLLLEEWVVWCLQDPATVSAQLSSRLDSRPFSWRNTYSDGQYHGVANEHGFWIMRFNTHYRSDLKANVVGAITRVDDVTQIRMRFAPNGLSRTFFLVWFGALLLGTILVAYTLVSNFLRTGMIGTSALIVVLPIVGMALGYGVANWFFVRETRDLKSYLETSLAVRFPEIRKRA